MTSDGATDAQVREALRGAGIEVGKRGRLSDEQYAAYEGLLHDAGVADGGGEDWPTADLDGPSAPTMPLPPLQDEPVPLQAERPPRAIGAPAGSTGHRIRDRIRNAASGGDAPPKDPPRGKAKSGSGGRGRGRRRPEQPWRPTAGVIGTIWERAAQASAGIPPLQRILAAQAPMAGVVLEGQLRGTLADRVILQPAARMEAQADAVLAMGGVPVLTALIAFRGRVQLAPGPDGQMYPVMKPDGMPAWEPGTEMMVTGLKYCLMSWLAVTDRHSDEIIAQAEASVKKGRDADDIIRWIFGGPPPEGPQSWEDLQAEAARAADDFLRPDRGGEDPAPSTAPPPSSSAFRPAITGTVLR